MAVSDHGPLGYVYHKYQSTCANKEQVSLP
jgi:hypothetical protein